VSSNLIIKEVKLFNLTGSLIMSKIVDNTSVELSLSKLQSGVYLLEISRENNEKTKVMKIVKQ